MRVPRRGSERSSNWRRQRQPRRTHPVRAGTAITSNSCSARGARAAWSPSQANAETSAKRSAPSISGRATSDGLGVPTRSRAPAARRSDAGSVKRGFGTPRSPSPSTSPTPWLSVVDRDELTHPPPSAPLPRRARWPRPRPPVPSTRRNWSGAGLPATPPGLGSAASSVAQPDPGPARDVPHRRLRHPARRRRAPERRRAGGHIGLDGIRPHEPSRLTKWTTEPYIRDQWSGKNGSLVHLAYRARDEGEECRAGTHHESDPAARVRRARGTAVTRTCRSPKRGRARCSSACTRPG